MISKLGFHFKFPINFFASFGVCKMCVKIGVVIPTHVSLIEAKLLHRNKI